MIKWILLSLGVIVCVSSPLNAATRSPSAPNLTALARSCGNDVDPVTVLAIIAQESAGNPYSVSVNATLTEPAENFVFDNPEAAASKAERAISKGRSVDMGLMMINSANIPTLEVAPKDLFDPCRNIKVGTTMLKQWFLAAQQELAREGTADMDGQRALARALSRYNTGSPQTGLKNGYVAKVKEKVVPSINANLPTGTISAEEIAGTKEAAMRADMEITLPTDPESPVEAIKQNP